MGFLENRIKHILFKTYQQIKLRNPKGLCKKCKANADLKPQLIEMGICKKCNK